MLYGVRRASENRASLPSSRERVSETVPASVLFIPSTGEKEDENQNVD